MRKYNVVVVAVKTGKETIMTSSPVSHDEACVILSKLTKYPFRVNTVKEV